MQKNILNEIRKDNIWLRERRRNLKRLDKRGLKIGTLVCSCNYTHSRIATIDWDDDDITLENGSSCSVRHCGIAPVKKNCQHPSQADMKKFIEIWWPKNALQKDKDKYLQNFK